MGLHENMQKEPVSRLALREPITASSDALIRDVIPLMREKQLGCVVAVDAGHKPLGVFTESMLTGLLAENPGGIDEPLANHFMERWPWVKLTDKVVDVLGAIELKNVRFLCVVDDDGKLVGLTGQKGLMEYVSEHFPEQVMVQRVGNTPYTQHREGA